MQRGTVVVRSLRFFLRSHVGLILGVAAATAVIVGALVVGDCMRGSLRSLVLKRMSNIVMLLRARNYFDPKCLQNLDIAQVDPSLSLAPIILLTDCSAESREEAPAAETSSADRQRSSVAAGRLGTATKVQVVAIDQRFMAAVERPISSSSHDPQESWCLPAIDEIWVNQTLAKELNLRLGSEVTLRLSKTSGVPADNPLGRRDEGSIQLPRQKVVKILADDGLGGLSFQTTQAPAFNVFASLSGVQDLLEIAGQVNAALVFSSSPGVEAQSVQADWAKQASQRLRPTLEDYGFQLHRRLRVFPDSELGEVSTNPPEKVFDYFQISSKELLIDDSTANAIVDQLSDLSHYRTMTYLANSICKVRSLPYETQRRAAERRNMPMNVDSVVSADDWDSPQTPIGRVVPYSILLGAGHEEAVDLGLQERFTIPPRELRAPYCWVNSWLADQLEIVPGDWVQMQFYDPETVDGDLRESFVRMMVVGVLPLEQPERPYRRNRAASFSKPPTRYNDSDLTPTVPGITNQESISNWDVPFELKLKDLILPQDDEYWENHRLTPKILLPYSYARNFFYSRFGSTTAIHVPALEGLTESEVRQRVERGLLAVRAQAGLTFQPVRYLQLKAASGTTPFDMLFLSLSMFVIMAALLLVALLFQLGFQQRIPQMGLLFALGFTGPQIRRMVLQEMMMVASLGALVGIPLGIAYAALLVTGLESWWIDAIQTRFLQFSMTPRSLLVGATGGILASSLAIFLGIRAIAKSQPLRLLRGQERDSAPAASVAGRSALGLAAICLLLAIFFGFLGIGQLGMLRAGCFFGSGMFLLLGSLLVTRFWLDGSGRRGDPSKQGLWSLALRAIVRNPMRSTLSIGLLAVATFLIASMSVFQNSTSPQGYGTFDLVGVSSQPIFENLGSPRVRKQTIGVTADEILGSTIIPIRMSEGDDASCTNLYQVTLPTFLGMSDKLERLGDLTDGFQFSWAATIEPDSPWKALQFPGTGDRAMPIPVILDQNTALWSLKQGGSLDSLIELELDGQRYFFRVVGLLSNSILQGKLIVSENNFERLFPKISGYRYFLIKSGDNVASEKVAGILEDGWSDSGLDVTSSREILERLLSVQNTYISAFQALGALGLLLGTVGLIAVQMRSISERKKELALMQAIGFPRRRLVQLLSLESGILLVSGMLIGLACSAVALVPYVAEVGPRLSILHPIVMLGCILCCGLVAAAVASRMALRLPVIPCLRGD